MRLKLFVSHASEDKDEFVRLLAAELREKFDVWYDEYSLRMGDSLRESIDRGLRECDFGIVVLSPAFFAKKWTGAELNGLVALETANRKIILPIWLGVTSDEVLGFSPMLHDRVAARAEDGIPRVVGQIAAAVDASARTVDVVAPDRAKRALSAAMATVMSRELDEKLLRTEAGVMLYKHAVNRIEVSIWERLSAFNLDGPQRFVWPKNAHGFVVQGPFHVSLSLGTRELYLNSVRDAQLVATVSLDSSYLENRGKKATLVEMIWHPTCASAEAIAFRKSAESPLETESQIAVEIVAEYADQIQKRLRDLEQKKVR